ncbi:hypothetical protein EV122DRAFT_282941 [Schizophyllum commune]
MFSRRVRTRLRFVYLTLGLAYLTDRRLQYFIPLFRVLIYRQPLLTVDCRFKCHPDQMALQYPSENPLVSLIDPRLLVDHSSYHRRPTHALHVAANQIIL